MTRRGLSPGAVTLLIVLGALIYFASFMRYGLAYDEGYLLDSVERILDGQVIYRDFHHTYAPGSFYLVAALFRAFGQNILVERWVFVVLEALKCGLAFLIVRTVTRSRLAYLAPVLAALAPGPWHKVFFPAFGFLALYAVLDALRRGSRWFLAAGVVIGVSAVFRQDVAVFAVVGALLALGIEVALSRQGPMPGLARLAWLALGVAVTVGPVCIWFASRGALGAMMHKLTVDGVLDNMTNRIPYPSLAARTGVDGQYILYILPVKLFFYLPFVAYGLGLVLLGRALAGRRWTRQHTALSVILVASMMAFNQSTFRADVGHFLQTMQYVFLLVPILLDSGVAWLGRRLARAGSGLAPAKAGLAGLAAAALVWVTIACTLATGGTLAPRFQREGLSIGDTEYIGSIVVRAGNNVKLGLDRAPVYVTPGE
ncbi:MAG TPA: glycosyltransferase family 39 protein, partial [bacterium]|nr:glycosyltransferase family 39 protein [bacterium]